MSSTQWHLDASQGFGMQTVAPLEAVHCAFLKGRKLHLVERLGRVPQGLHP